MFKSPEAGNKERWQNDFLYETVNGTLALILSHEVAVEISLDKNLRICHNGRLCGAVCGDGHVAAIQHQCMRIVQQQTEVTLSKKIIFARKGV